ncbi:MAG: hypothetical protein ACRYFX_16960 [Janthinobacterium lividum]
MPLSPKYAPAKERAQRRAEEAACQEALVYYEQVQAQLQVGAITQALLTIQQMPNPCYLDRAVQAVAMAQARAGTLLGALETAQRFDYRDTREQLVAEVIRVLLQQDDLSGAQLLTATVKGYSYVNLLCSLAEAQQQAGQAEAAQHTLLKARKRAQGFYEGDSKNGYPRDYYLLPIVQCHLRLNDVAGATQTAQDIRYSPDYRQQAFEAIEQA